MIPDVTGCVLRPGRRLKGGVSGVLVSHHDTLEHCDLVTVTHEVAGSSPVVPASVFNKFQASIPILIPSL